MSTLVRRACRCRASARQDDGKLAPSWCALQRRVGRARGPRCARAWRALAQGRGAMRLAIMPALCTVRRRPNHGRWHAISSHGRRLPTLQTRLRSRFSAAVGWAASPDRRGAVRPHRRVPRSAGRHIGATGRAAMSDVRRRRAAAGTSAPYSNDARGTLVGHLRRGARRTTTDARRQPGSGQDAARLLRTLYEPEESE